MSYPRKLIRVKPSKGLITDRDIPAFEVSPDFWTDARNVSFRDKFASRIEGDRAAYSDALAVANPVQLMHAVNVESGATNYWLLFEEDGTAWAIEGINATQIDAGLLPTTVTEPDQFSSAILNGLPVISNGSDDPVYWNGGVLLALPGWIATETCQFMASFKFHLFAMNIAGPGGTFQNLVKWSAAAASGSIPTSWTPLATNDAGNVELADSPGAVLCAYPLRDALVFYKRSSAYTAQYVGGNNVFQFRKIKGAKGTLTARSVCNLGDGRHLIVNDGDIVISNGTSEVPIGEDKVRNYLFEQLDQDNFNKLFCIYNKSRKEVLIAFPTVGNTFCNEALLLNVDSGAFGRRDILNLSHAVSGLVNDDAGSNRWSDRTDTWAQAVDRWNSSRITAARDSLVHIRADELIQQDTIDPVHRDAMVAKHCMDMGAPERIKFVRRVHVLAASGFGTLYVRVGSQMTPSGPINWSPEVSLTSPQQIVDTFAMGRYISIEIRSDNTRVWKVPSFDIEVEFRGYH